MRELLRRFVGWLFPPVDPDALAALDGGPGPELSAPDSAGATSPTGDDGADSPRTDEEIRAQIIARLADGLDIPEECLVVPDPNPWISPGAVDELRRRSEYEVLAALRRSEAEYRDRTELLP